MSQETNGPPSMLDSTSQCTIGESSLALQAKSAPCEVALPATETRGGAASIRNEAFALDRKVEPYRAALAVATSCLRPSLVPRTVQRRIFDLRLLPWAGEFRAGRSAG